VRGDCDVNEAKVGHRLNCRELAPASPMKPCAAGGTRQPALDS
jgi:hypothetical protein